MSTANPNKLKIKDIITVVLLALINVVIFFASSVLYATPITIILMPVFFALLEGIVYFIIGFGDKSVKDVCEAQGVDCPTFLAVANFISEEQYSYSGNESDFSIPALMDYLKRAHTYFLDFNLPAIRRKLIEAIDCSSTNDVAYLILKFSPIRASIRRRASSGFLLWSRKRG